MFSRGSPSPGPSGTTTPPRRPARSHATPPLSASAHGNLDHHPLRVSPSSSFISYPVSRVASSFFRRLTGDASSSVGSSPPPSSTPSVTNLSSQTSDPSTTTTATTMAKTQSHLSLSTDLHGVFHAAPHRTASPFAPPPLSPLSLDGVRPTTAFSAQILSKTVAEEIRLLLPPRQQLAVGWKLIYSVDQDGVSLGTLYNKCERYQGARHGFVLVVKDGAGGIFGAFLTEPPHPAPHYYGTGECFLWRATTLPASSTSFILANLPPPPSADTTNLQRSTTLASPRASTNQSNGRNFAMNRQHGSATTTNGSNNPAPFFSPPSAASGTSTPGDRIRFKAFPYSGVNDYMIFCEHSYLSVGGGDGRYGLWLDSSLEHGVSSQSMTFGNEALSEEGEKFEVVGVEVWYIGT